MKLSIPILLLCAAAPMICQRADARIVTLLLVGTNQTATLILQENESAKLARGFDAYALTVPSDTSIGTLELFKDGARFSFPYYWYEWPAPTGNFAVAGPAVITLNSGVTNRSGTQGVFVSFEVQPENYDVSKSVTLAPGSGGASIALENSTNLINWATATNGVYTNVPSATFFRVKAERLP